MSRIGLNQPLPLPGAPPRANLSVGRSIAAGGAAISRALSEIATSIARRQAVSAETDAIGLIAKSEEAAELLEPDAAEVRYRSGLESLRESMEGLDPLARSIAEPRIDRRVELGAIRVRKSALTREAARQDAEVDRRAGELLGAQEQGQISAADAIAEMGDLIDGFRGTAYNDAQALAKTRAVNEQVIRTAYQNILEVEDPSERLELIDELLGSAEAVMSLTVMERAALRRSARNDAIRSLDVQGLAAARAGDLQAVDRLAAEATELGPGDDRDALLARFRVFRIQAQGTSDGASSILAAYSGDRPFDENVAQDSQSLDAAYRALRQDGVPLTDITNFFVGNGSDLPPDFLRDVRGLFDPESSTFNVARGVEVLRVAASHDRESAGRLVQGSELGKVALSTGLKRDGDVVRLLSHQNAQRFLGELQPHLAPQTRIERATAVTFNWPKIVGDIDELPGKPEFFQNDIDELTNLLRLEYLRRRVDFGDGDDVKDVLGRTKKAAAEAFIASKWITRIPGVGTVYYDRSLPPPSQSFTNSIALLARVAAQRFDSVVRLDMATTHGPNRATLIPAVGDAGITLVMEYDVFRTDPPKPARAFQPNQPEFALLRDIVLSRNLRRQMHPVSHLAHHESFGTDTVQTYDRTTETTYMQAFRIAAEAQLGRTGLLEGLSDAQRRRAIFDEAQTLAQEVGWSAMMERRSDDADRE